MAPSDVAKSLLSAKDKGQKAANEFLDKCLTSGDRSFWAPLPKMKLKSFASLAKPLKLSKGKEKQVVISAHRQLWNRLAIASNSQDIDFRDVLCHDLSPVPFSLSTLDGSLQKPNKAVLLHELEIERETVVEVQPFEGKTAATIFNWKRIFT